MVREACRVAYCGIVSVGLEKSGAASILAAMRLKNLFLPSPTILAKHIPQKRAVGSIPFSMSFKSHISLGKGNLSP